MNRGWKSRLPVRLPTGSLRCMDRLLDARRRMRNQGRAASVVQASAGTWQGLCVCALRLLAGLYGYLKEGVVNVFDIAGLSYSVWGGTATWYGDFPRHKVS